MCWNGALVEEVFCAREAAVILAMPLIRLGCADSMVWQHQKNRKYTVRSGYKFFLNLLIDTVSPSSADEKIIWSSQLPRKIQGFLWRLTHGILPSCMSARNGLAKRKIVDSSRCFHCPHEDETCMHAVWACALRGCQ